MTIQKAIRAYLAYRRNGGPPPERYLIRQRAAIVIQRAFRVHLQRRIDELTKTIVHMQAIARGVLGRRNAKRMKVEMAFEWLSRSNRRR